MKKTGSFDWTDKSESDLKSRQYWDRIRKCGQRYKNFDWPAVYLFLNFIHTYGVVSRHLSKTRSAKTGLSPASFNILMILSRSVEGGCKQRDISRLMFVSRANITGLIDQLVRRGLVERTADQNDRRVWIAKITKKGEALLESYLPGYYKELKDLLAVFSKADKAMFNRFLEKLQNTIE